MRSDTTSNSHAPVKLPYYMKFSRLHVYFTIVMCAYFVTLKFRDFAKILYFESL